MRNNIAIVILIISTTVGAVALARSGHGLHASALITLATTMIPHLGGGGPKKNKKKDDDEE